MTLVDDLVETWRINNQVNLYLLGHITDDALEAQMQGYGRSVKAILIHIHNVRIQWLQVVVPNGKTRYVKIPSRSAKDKADISRAILEGALIQSGDALADVLYVGLNVGKIPNVKPHPASFLAYLIAHDTHHRGEIGIVLAQTGYKLPSEIDHSLWDWQKHYQSLL